MIHAIAARIDSARPNPNRALFTPRRRLRRLRLPTLFSLLGVCMFLSACMGPAPQEYLEEKPAINLRHFLDGELEAWGMIQYPNGKVITRITGTMKATWLDDSHLTLDEKFLFSSGEVKTRQWQIRKVDEHNYIATASDAVGEAKIELYGNAMRWDYQLKVPVGGSEYVFSFDDWMWQIDPNAMLNRAKMKKFGITVSELTFFFKKK